MKTLWLLMVLMTSLNSLQAQTGHSRAGLDGFHYVWTDTELQKINNQAQVQWSWQKPAGGPISWIDPANPFRILVFVKQSSQVYWLNNKLILLSGPVFLPDLGITDPLAVASARDGGIWVIDAASGYLIKLDNKRQKRLEAPLKYDLNSQTGQLIQLAEWKDYLAILLPGQSLLIADLYGQVIKKIKTSAVWLDTQQEGLLLTGTDLEEVYQPDSGQLKSLIKKP